MVPMVQISYISRENKIKFTFSYTITFIDQFLIGTHVLHSIFINGLQS